MLISAEDATKLNLRPEEPVLLTNELGQFEGRVWIVPIAAGNLQIHWPEGNVLIQHGIWDPAGGVPDYNARVRLIKREKARL